MEPSSANAAIMQPWTAFTQRLGEIGHRIHGSVDTNKTAEQHGEVDQAMIAALCMGAMFATRLDPDYPEWLPFISSVLLAGNPCPDFTYYVTRIKADATYRLRGTRGTAQFAELQINQGLMGFTDKTATLTILNLDDVSEDEDGQLLVILSPERPAGHTGNWVSTKSESPELLLILRQCSTRWTAVTDGHMTIERLGPPSARRYKDVRDAGARLKEVSEFVDRFASTLVRIMAAQADTAGPVNTVANITNKFAGQSLVSEQTYYHSDIRIGLDEALIMETTIPADCPYWSVQLMDRFYNALDTMFHQTGMSGETATIEPDGTLRLVIAHRDPGVANWLDISGYAEGAVRWRLLRCIAPEISTRLIRLAEVIAEAGSRYAANTPVQRRQALADRLIGSQRRRRW